MRYVISLALSTLLVVALFVLDQVMLGRMQEAVSLGRDIPLWERLLASLSRFWGRYWWLFAPAIYGAPLLLLLLLLWSTYSPRKPI